MRDASALWSVGYVTAAEVVEVAGDLLVAGYDGPALCTLAAVSACHPRRTTFPNFSTRRFAVSA